MREREWTYLVIKTLASSMDEGRRLTSWAISNSVNSSSGCASLISLSGDGGQKGKEEEEKTAAQMATQMFGQPGSFVIGCGR